MSAIQFEPSRRVDACIQALERFNQESEKHFIQIGRVLQGVAKGADHLADCAADMCGSNGARRFGEAARRFEGLVGQIEEARRGALTIPDSLGRIAGLAREFRRPAKEFARSKRTFHLLNLYMRVEASRLKSDHAEFSGLADDIDTLVTEIDECSQALNEKAVEAANRLGAGRSQLEVLRDKHTRESSNLIDHLSRGGAEAHAKEGESEAAAQSLADGCRKCRDEITNLVHGLQYQDICRQRLEHVCQGLTRLKADAAARNVQETALSFRLLRRQLDDAGSEIRSALDRIARSLQQTRSRLLQLRTEARTLSEPRSTADEYEGQLASEAQRCVLTITRLREIVNAVEPAMKQMHAAAERIETTGHRIGLIAMNCAVKTAHLGENGAALGVVAAEMGRLAATTETEVYTTQNKLKELKDEAGTLFHLSSSTVTGELESNVAASCSESSLARREYRRRLLGVIEVTDRLLSDMGLEMSKGEAGGRLFEGLDLAQRTLAELTSQMPVPDGWESTITATRFADLYTMQSERLVDNLHLSGQNARQECSEANDESCSGDVELF